MQTAGVREGEGIWREQWRGEKSTRTFCPAKSSVPETTPEDSLALCAALCTIKCDTQFKTQCNFCINIKLFISNRVTMRGNEDIWLAS